MVENAIFPHAKKVQVWRLRKFVLGFEANYFKKSK